MAWYGSDPEPLAEMWVDLQTTEIESARMELTVDMLDDFLMAHNFLFNYVSGEMMAGIWKLCKDTVRPRAWTYVCKIAMLKFEKITWPEEWYCNGHPIFLFSVDGTHLDICEPMHPTMSKNPDYYSHKSKNPAYNYELALSLWESRIVWINGPYPASVHDISVFRMEGGLKEQIPNGSRGVGDKGYSGESQYISGPNSHDTKDVRDFKGRARARQEALNAKIKAFGCMKNEYKHGPDNHRMLFEAVCVVIQYQMENGSPLFDV